MQVRAGLLGAACLMLAFLPGVRAGTVVTALPIAVPGTSLYEYDLTVDNTTGPDPVSGVLVSHGDTVFALDASSTILAPAGWNFIAPFASVVDPLSYFALTPADDIGVGNQLGGFSFQSLRAPETLAPGDFDVQIVYDTAGSSTPVDIGDAVLLPEPTPFALAGIGVLTLCLISLRSRRASRS